MNKKKCIIAVCLLLMLTSLLFAGKGKSAESRVSAGAVRTDNISDGDTIAVICDGRFEKVRLIGIDAPELAQRPWGRRAKRCLEALVEDADAAVSLEYDIVPRDKYGRLLAYVWTRDRKMINEEMLKKGCAVLFTYPPNVRYIRRFRAALKTAQDNKRGIWGENGLKEQPSDYRKNHPRR